MTDGKQDTKKFRVELPHGPTHVFKAVDASEAIAKYNELCGVLGTDHQHTVTDVAVAEASEKAYDAMKQAQREQKVWEKIRSDVAKGKGPFVDIVDKLKGDLEEWEARQEIEYQRRADEIEGAKARADELQRKAAAELKEIDDEAKAKEEARAAAEKAKAEEKARIAAEKAEAEAVAKEQADADAEKENTDEADAKADAEKNDSASASVPDETKSGDDVDTDPPEQPADKPASQTKADSKAKPANASGGTKAKPAKA